MPAIRSVIFLVFLAFAGAPTVSAQNQQPSRADDDVVRVDTNLVLVVGRLIAS